MPIYVSMVSNSKNMKFKQVKCSQKVVFKTQPQAQTILKTTFCEHFGIIHHAPM